MKHRDYRALVAGSARTIVSTLRVLARLKAHLRQGDHWNGAPTEGDVVAFAAVAAVNLLVSTTPCGRRDSPELFAWFDSGSRLSSLAYRCVPWRAAEIMVLKQELSATSAGSVSARMSHILTKLC